MSNTLLFKIMYWQAKATQVFHLLAVSLGTAAHIRDIDQRDCIALDSITFIQLINPRKRIHSSPKTWHRAPAFLSLSSRPAISPQFAYRHPIKTSISCEPPSDSQRKKISCFLLMLLGRCLRRKLQLPRSMARSQNFMDWRGLQMTSWMLRSREVSCLSSDDLHYVGAFYWYW